LNWEGGRKETPVGFVGLEEDRGYAARVAELRLGYTWRVALRGHQVMFLRGPCKG
jgi:hypothetical protein